MKRFMLSMAILLIAGCASMQQSPDAGKPSEYVLAAQGKTKDQIFSITKSWIAETFVSAKDVIDDADPKAGLIIAKGIVPHPCIQAHGCGSNSISFTLRVDMKDGKLRMIFSNPLIISPPIPGTLKDYESRYSPKMVGDVEDTHTAFEKLRDSLNSYISKGSADKNW